MKITALVAVAASLISGAAAHCEYYPFFPCEGTNLITHLHRHLPTPGY